MRLLPAFVLAAAIATGVTCAFAQQAAAPAAAPKVDPANTLVIELKSGPVQIQLRPDIAPLHIARVKQLTKEGFYNGLKFHRVIDGFMAQTGDPKGTGAGGSTMPDLKAEFTRTLFKRGTIGAARTSEPNTANSQFFICFDDKGCMGLTGQYTVWGQVVSGMENVDKIARGEPPRTPDTMQKVYLLSDKK